MKFINLTPHAIVMNNGVAFQPSGTVARVSTVFSNSPECPTPHSVKVEGCDYQLSSGFCKGECQSVMYDINEAIECSCDECRNNGGCGHWIETATIKLFRQAFGEIVDLPMPQYNTKYIVSGMVLDAAKKL